MKLDLKRNALVIIPETDADDAFIEDTLGLAKNGDSIKIDRVNNVELGFVKTDKFALIVKGKDFK